MKKIIAILLTVIMCTGLAACGGGTSGAANTSPAAPTAAAPAETAAPVTEPATEPEARQEVTYLSLGDTIQNDKFTMTFESMDILSEYKYKTSEYSSTSLYVENGYKLLLVRGHMENTSTAVISDNCFVRTATVNGEYVVSDYDVRLSFARSKYFEIDPYTEIEYFLYINIPEKLAEKFETAEFTIGFNDDMSTPVTTWDLDGTKSTPTDHVYALVGGLGSAETAAEDADARVQETVPAAEDADVRVQETAPAAVNYKELNQGDVISTEDFDFTLNQVELTYELKPSNTSGVYTSYEAPDGKVYIHVDGYYYNKSKKDVCIRDLFVPSADYDNGYTYKGFALVDEDDNDFTWVNSYVICTPLETCHYHGLIECPKVIDSSDASLVVYLKIGGETYAYTVR